MLLSVLYLYLFFNCQGTTKCELLSYDACKEFAVQFDRLYIGRDEDTYPDPNPMRKSNTDFLSQDINEIFDNVQFPTGYWFRQDERGVIDRASFDTSAGAGADGWYGKDGWFTIVNPTTGKALGLVGNDCLPDRSSGGNGKYHAHYGPPVEIQDHNRENERQQFRLTNTSSLVSLGCPGKAIITSYGYDASPRRNTDMCIAGAVLSTRNILPVSIKSHITASTVRVQLDFTNHLSLTQVEVYDTLNTNRAQNGTATQSSTRHDTETARHAIDGDMNTHTHTNSRQQGENQTYDLQLLTRNTIVPHCIAIVFLFALNPLIYRSLVGS